MFSLGIPTVTRPYRQHLFARLASTGTLEHHLLKGFHISYDRGPNESAYHVLRQCCDDGAPWVMFLEDDIEIIDDFLSSTARWLHDYARPDVHFYPLGSGVRRGLRKARQDGLGAFQWPLKDYYGTCGFVMRTEDCRAFLDAASQKPDWMVEWNCLDVNLCEWHTRVEPGQEWILTPSTCLIDHRGAVSSLSSDPVHWTGTFDGFGGTHYRY
jgi:hypothetical protein